MKFREILEKYRMDPKMSEILSGEKPIKVKAIELEGTPSALSADQPEFDDEPVLEAYKNDPAVLEMLKKLDKINKKKLKSK